MALLDRLLSFTFTLASDTFAESGTDTVEITDRRATAKVIKAGTPSLGEAQLQIFGMTKSVMDKLATLGMAFQLVPRNTVTVKAGTDVNSMAIVFYGTITQAWGDFQAQPEVPFNVLAHTLGSESVINSTPLSFNGSTDVAGVMSQLAGKMGCTFENNGINKKLSSPYLYGSARSQADQCAAAAGIEWFADDKTLACWPKGGARTTNAPILVAPPPRGKMVGYPSYTAYGLSIKNEYDPNFKFGGQIQVESSLSPAVGLWNIVGLAHSLASQMPRGDWFSSIEAFNPKFPQPIR